MITLKMPSIGGLNYLENKTMKYLHKIAFLLVVIGGLNWLLLAVLGWEVGQLFGGMDALVSKVIYILVGLAALYEVVTHFGRCKECSATQQV